MDIDTRCGRRYCSLLADANVVSEDVLRESARRQIYRYPDSWRARYGGDPSAKRQLTTPVSSGVQADNVRRMLLAMVDDFRCVVIKLAEHRSFARSERGVPEDERVLAAKECTNIWRAASLIVWASN